jgi:hypothetical protein
LATRIRAFGCALASLAGCVIPLSAPATGGNTTQSGAVITVCAPDDAGFDGAPGWTPATQNLAGLPSDCGNLSYLSAVPGQDTVLAAVVDNGLYSSAANPAAWMPLGSGGPNGSRSIANRAQHILYDPQQPATYWEAGAYGPCLYATADGGNTFAQLGPNTVPSVAEGGMGPGVPLSNCDSVSVDFTDPARQTILAGGHEGHHVFRSLDGGATFLDIGPNVPGWEPGVTGDGSATGFVLALSPTVYLVASWQLQGHDGIYRSSDAGATWKEVWANAARSVPLVVTDPESGRRTIYWVLYNPEMDDSGGVVKSTDDGVNWTLLSGSGGVLSTQQGISVLPNGTLATLGVCGIVLSKDSGNTWWSWGPQLTTADLSPGSSTISGIIYAPRRQTFYVWQFQCYSGPDAGNPVTSNDILTVPFDYGAF